MEIELPREIRDSIRDKFGALPVQITPLAGGFSHAAWVCDIDGNRCVVKASNFEPYRAELWHEAEVLIGLDYAKNDWRHAKKVALLQNGEWLMLVLEWLDGVPGPQFFGGDMAALRPRYIALAKLLARLHRSEVSVLRSVQNDVVRANSFNLHSRAKHALENLAALNLDADVHHALTRALAHRVWQSGTPVFVHGDAGLHNVLFNRAQPNKICALLDWEWAGWGPALADLAWLNWTMRWRKYDALWPAVLAAYQRAAGNAEAISPASLRALQLGQIGMILLRSRSNAPAVKEWLRRARWMLDNPKI